MACMDGVVEMVAWIVVGICMSVLVAGVVYGIYMAIWGIYDEYTTPATNTDIHIPTTIHATISTTPSIHAISSHLPHLKSIE
jgi:hypothetical protein